MKRFFHSELENFRGNVVLMGELAIEQVNLAVEGMESRDIDMAESVLQRDDEIDQMEIAIDSAVVRYISLRAPVATELRLLMIGMKAAHDLERVGDEACTIAKQTRLLAGSGMLLPLHHILPMARLGSSMLRDALDGFLSEDGSLARSIPMRDKEVDRLNRENFDFFKEQMREFSEHIDEFFRLVLISKSLERIADHATNLAEEVIFLHDAKDIRHSSATQRSLDRKF